ncbi:ABC transporter substrate-binding protein [Aestuariimicrobium sp. T2.26MG-19.2B]|uniref:ABC transporter substrate-binding protein n=1 Tax=Aestuariimicrobium sp. T2.26MG-19.2B TaxID=3040679 RepID=UPI00247741B2|nr:ABC transporter substrate-binding protein [Aestuariimicrobium sp. T2.26MG-19.2B]CAI9410597.1 putative D,D-dipeptide-binding periplasmic protein DdpA [Aestuariimicrobium sp. T2.26MG-19.2B]
MGQNSWGRTQLGRRSLIAGVAAAAVVAAAGCSTSKTGEQPSSSNPGRSLFIGAVTMPETFDLVTNNDAAIPQVLLYNVYETLVKIDGDGQLRPLLATAWTVSDDRLTYTFTLQSGAKFASGTPVNADAVMKSLNLLRQTGNAVIKARHQMVETIEATDDKTLTVTLSKPSQEWLYSLTSSSGVVIDPDGFTTLATKPMGSGPFAFDSWNKGSDITLVRNGSYWGTGTRFDKVTWRYFKDANAMNAAMLSGDLDIISNVAAPQTLPQFSDPAKFTVLEGTTNGEVVLGFNHDTPALKNLKLRQAICHAIDRQAVIDTVWGGKGTLIGSMVPPTDPWYEDLSNTYPYDVEKAKQLVAESGIKNPTLRLRVPSLPYATGAVQLLTSQLKAAGITLKSDVLEFPGRWLDVVYTKGDYDLTIVAHVESHDLGNWANPKYYWHYDNPTFQALMAEADASDEQTAIEKYKQAAKILADDAAADFLFLLPNLIVTKPDIHGVSPNATSLSFDLTTVTSKLT